LDFLEESLKEIAGISIHFSSDCNMACKYCYIEKDKKCMASYNRDIR
jgi:DNA repair photolyase